MAERAISLGTSEMGVTILKETLNAQQELLQRLYNELDFEREAAATATSEALSMMLRLQGEKAAVEMEACQYKRIAEEKMVHAEETLAIFREIVYQKEMQIASLEFQVQAYRFRLLSLGYNDLGVCETQYPQNMLRRNDIMADSRDVQCCVRRGNSLPPIFPKDGEVSTEREKSSENSPKLLEQIKEHNLLTDKKLENSTAGDFNSYWEQIRKLNERLKELSISKDGFPRSNSPHSQASSGSPQDPTREEFHAKSDKADCPENLLFEESGDSACHMKIQDKFEVPQTFVFQQVGVFQRAEKGKLSLEAENQLGKPVQVCQEVNNSGVTDKRNWNKRSSVSPDSDDKSSKQKEGLFQRTEKRKLSLETEKRLGKPVQVFQEVNNSGVTNTRNWDKRSSVSPDSDDKSPQQREGLTLDPQLCFKCPGVGDFEIRQLNRQLKNLEDERIVTRQEISVVAEEENLRLLKEIKDQLKSIQDEIMRWRTKKPPSLQQPALDSLAEAMLHFWL
ncbi:hypothetical protein Nepgr_018453 [Nepenthes gracilis]|uniref:GTD-binding domain-containing protein n=1 Tax=Nepenthes gracilis TaxID=150966 RepID=A0AAD3ST30_NEPGR|nr:hypothetical protein Nepgr_018453 [Nepenthes gracilis]